MRVSHMLAVFICSSNLISSRSRPIFGLLLLFGWQTRIVALLLALHLFDIMWTVGYGEIGVRDFGLAMGTLVVFMNGPDLFCVQEKKRIARVMPPPPIQPQRPAIDPLRQQRRLV